MTGSLKAIGTNVNIIVAPIMLCISTSYSIKKAIDTESLYKILRFISLLGLISVAFTWIVDFRDILRVFGGVSAYRVNVSGFFYSKNIYGAFVSLTLAADLYLLILERKLKRLIIVGIKILAIVLSFSRAALLLTGIMLFVFFWTKKKRTSKDYVVLFTLIVAVIAGLLYIRSNYQLYNFFLNSVLRVKSGDAGRTYFRNLAMARMGDSLISSIFGVGFAGLDALDIDIDNTYLYLWFTGGIFKLFFYVGALVMSFQYIGRMKKKSVNVYRLCCSVEISYLFFAFFESVAVLELGLLNFLFTIYMFMIPCSCDIDVKKDKLELTVESCA